MRFRILASPIAPIGLLAIGLCLPAADSGSAPTSSVTTSNAASASSWRDNLAALERRLKAPTLGTILDLLKPIPSLDAIFATADSAASRPARRELSQAEDRSIQEHLARLTSFRSQGKFGQAVEEVRAIAASYQSGLGNDDLRTIEARRQVPMMEGIASLPPDRESEMVKAERFQQLLYAQGGLADSRAIETSLQVALAVERALGPEHPLFADALVQLAIVLRENQPSRSLDALYEKAIAIYRHDFGELSLDLAGSIESFAIALRRQYRFAPAETLLRKALATRLAPVAWDPAEAASTLNVLGGLLAQTGDYANGKRAYSAALRIAEMAKNDAIRADAKNNMGILCWTAGNCAEAERLYSEALDIYRPLVGELSTQFEIIQGARAQAFLSCGELERAEVLCREAQSLARLIHGDASVESAEAMNRMAVVLHRKGELASAEKLHRATLAMRQKRYGSLSLEVAESENNLARVLRDRRALDEAEQLYSSALAMRERLLGRDRPQVAEAQHNLGALLLEKGQLQAAEVAFKRALSINESHFGRNNPACVEQYCALARIADGQKRYEDARRLLEKVVGIETESGVRGPHNHRISLAQLLLTRFGDARSAAAMFEAAIEQIESQRLQVGGDELDRARYFGTLSSSSAFGGMVRAQIALASQASNDEGTRDAYLHKAFDFFERGRSRSFLDLMSRCGKDLFTLVRDRAVKTHDDALSGQIDSLKSRELKAVEGIESARRQDLATRNDPSLDDATRIERLAAIEARARSARSEERLVLRELHALAREELGSQRLSPLRCAEVSASLKDREILLAYDIGDRDALLLAVRPTGMVSVYSLKWPDGTQVDLASLGAAVRDAVVSFSGEAVAALSRGRGHDAADLYPALFPMELRGEIAGAARIIVIPDGSLYRLPFDALIVDRVRKTRWIDSGPPVVYGPSGTVVALKRLAAARRSNAMGDEDRPALVAIGAPEFDAPRPASKPATRESEPPEGVLVLRVEPGSNAAQAGLQSGDILLAYGGSRVENSDELALAMRDEMARPKQINAATNPGGVSLQAWRNGAEIPCTVPPGRLGIKLTPLAVRQAWPLYRALTSGHIGPPPEPVPAPDYREFEAWPPLPFSGYEVESIAACMIRSGCAASSVKVHLGPNATFANLMRDATHPRFLHLATHAYYRPGFELSDCGIVLGWPKVLTSTDRSELRLTDLLYGWSGKLEGTELAVLSACGTGLGPIEVGEGPVALAWGFMFAGADSVVASLWDVRDPATMLLMKRLYQNLEGDYVEVRGGNQPHTRMRKAEALHEAKRWLSNATQAHIRQELRAAGIVPPEPARLSPPKDRARHSDRPTNHIADPYDLSDPHYWAGFLIYGDPG